MKRFTALCLSVVMLMSSILYTSAPQSYATTQEELQAEIDRIEEQIARAQDKVDSLDDEAESEAEKLEALQAQYSAVNDKVETFQAQVDVIDAEISTLESQIDELEDEIYTLDLQISQNEEDIVTIQENIVDTSEALSAQLRASYMTGSSSTLLLLMGSDTLASFLTRIEMMKRLSEQETEIINAFKDTATELEDLQEELATNQETLESKLATLESSMDEAEESRSDLVTAQASYSSSIAEYEAQAQELEDYINSLSVSSEAYQDYIQEQYAAQAEKEAELDDLIDAYISSNTNSSTGQLDASNDDSSSNEEESYTSSASWYWPLGNFSCYISSYFGERESPTSGASTDHGAIDIAGTGIYGQPIYATRSGTVALAQSYDNGGYGIYVMIDHGDNYLSLYGHCSKIVVSVGDYVTQGQVIGYVGSTGVSTGPHLHFEIRYNGTKVNPLNYVTMP